MASVDFFGPYLYTRAGGLAPGAARRLGWSIGPELWASTVTVTAIPVAGHAEQRVEAAVSGTSVSLISHQRAATEVEVHATVTNTGKGLIDVLVVYLSFVSP